MISCKERFPVLKTCLLLLSVLGVVLGYSVLSGTRLSGQVLTIASSQDTIQRFLAAIRHINRTFALGHYPQWHCPESFQLGARIGPWNNSRYVGTPCEPWVVRPIIPVLHDVLLPGSAKALEWSSGSSTLFLLLHVRHLTSIEHDAEWAGNLTATLQAALGQQFLASHWDLHVVPHDDSSVTPNHTDRWGWIWDASRAAATYRSYTAASWLGPEHDGSFDFVSIDGVARINCFPRALELLKPQGGILLLDNAGELDALFADKVSWRELVPKHWPMFEASYDPCIDNPEVCRGLRYEDSRDTTRIWISCQEGQCLGH